MSFLQAIDADLIASVLRSLIPILLAALGGMLCERAGVFNIALEGMILLGCFGAVAGSFFTGSWLLGVLLGAVSAAVFFTDFGLRLGLSQGRPDCFSYRDESARGWDYRVFDYERVWGNRRV